jgi:hypothetical protein
VISAASHGRLHIRIDSTEHLRECSSAAATEQCNFISTALWMQMIAFAFLWWLSFLGDAQPMSADWHIIPVVLDHHGSGAPIILEPF